MVSFNQTKGQMSSLENNLKSVQVTLEKTQFALEIKQGKGPFNPDIQARKNTLFHN